MDSVASEPQGGHGGRPLAATAGLFLAGAAAGFAAHEGCHVAANLAMGNVPQLEPVRFAGAIPFFSIAPGITCGRDRCTTRSGAPFSPGLRGLSIILTAGLQCQHLYDEVILTHEPDLRAADAPFRTGMLAFGILASLAYVTADVASFEPPAGDLSALYRDTKVSRRAMNALLAATALLDAARYALPRTPVLPWASRASKGATFGVSLAL